MSGFQEAFEKLCSELAKNLNCRVSPDGAGAFALEVPVAEGRKQWVRLTTATDQLGSPQVELTSKVGSSTHVDPVVALKINGAASYGGLALQEGTMVWRATTFVGTNALTLNELLTLVRHVASYADRIERNLHGADVDVF